MKKIIKLLIATMLISVMAICVTACGGKTMDKVFDSEKNETKYTPFDVVYMAELGDYEVDDEQGAWLVLSDYDNKDTLEDDTDDTISVALYNWEIQKKVWEKTYTYEEAMELDDMPVMLEDFGLGAFGFVFDTETEEYTVYYGGEANQNVGKISSEPTENYDAGLVKIGKYVFAGQKDGSIKVIENETIDISRIDYFANGFYYETDIDWQEYVTVYDATLNVIGKVEVPSYANGWFEFLSNGNLLMQYVYTADQKGADYDYIAWDEDTNSDVKYFMETYIYNVEKNALEAVETDYYIVNVTSNYTDGVTKYALSEKVDNIAWAQKIVDKRLDYHGDIITLDLSNEGKISVIEKAFDLLLYADMDPVAGGYFFAENVAGEKVLLDAEFEIVATFGKNAHAEAEYIVDGDKYYSTNGTLIVDVEETEYTFVKSFKTSILFYDSENTAYYLLNNGECKKIAKTVEGESEAVFVSSLSNNYVYTIKTREYDDAKSAWSDWKYTVYNEDGVKLTETNDPTGEHPDKIDGTYFVADTANGTLMKVNCRIWNEDKEGGAGYESKTEYYIITRKAA